MKNERLPSSLFGRVGEYFRIYAKYLRWACVDLFISSRAIEQLP
jgi:hypothetical protein